MSGCPYCKFDYSPMAEKCDVTGKLTNGAMTCDFGYEECPHYKSQHRHEE